MERDNDDDDDDEVEAAVILAVALVLVLVLLGLLVSSSSTAVIACRRRVRYLAVRSARAGACVHRREERSDEEGVDGDEETKTLAK